MDDSELKALKSEAEKAVQDCKSVDDLNAINVRYLGKKGSVTDLSKNIKNLSVEDRKTFGQEINLLKESLTQLIADRRGQIMSEGGDDLGDFDITLPGELPARGTLHPILTMMDDLNEAFHSLGFEIYEGPEISSEAFCFDSLNFPPDHPARESMDTYWLAGHEKEKGAKRLCLRPHLTGASVRYMQTHKPPMRFVYPGRVYRNESTDASHERAFFQYEALIIDRVVPFSSGRLLVNTILEQVFGRKIKTRMRSGFFPFVEPGFEIDMQCLVCEGKGCSVCKRVGWLEMMPGGPPHPNVMRAGGLDPNEWQGFYINIGLDRLTMMKHNVDDIRLFSSTDLRFLKQFE